MVKDELKGANNDNLTQRFISQEYIIECKNNNKIFLFSKVKGQIISEANYLLLISLKKNNKTICKYFRGLLFKNIHKWYPILGGQGGEKWPKNRHRSWIASEIFWPLEITAEMLDKWKLLTTYLGKIKKFLFVNDFIFYGRLDLSIASLEIFLSFFCSIN